VFVNNDMRFAADFVERLIDPLLRDSTIFCTDARQRDWKDTSDIHQATFLDRASLVGGRRRSPLPGVEIRQEPASSDRNVVQGCAGNMAVRRWMFEALGGFDARMQAGWEDTDLCWSAWLRGWRTVYVPRAVCWHKVGASSRTSAGWSWRRRGEVEGRLLFAVRHLPVASAMIVWASTIGSMVRDFLRRDDDRARVTAASIGHSLSWLASAVGERRRMHRAADTTPSAHLRALTRI
jgi:GT2 family glycosyltransferase